MKGMDLSTNKLTGTIPMSFGNLTKLAQVSFVNNSFTSTIPANIMQLPLLFEVYFYNNSFSGTIPPVIAPKLQTFDARSNLLTGVIPSIFFSHPPLKVLSASDNCLSTDLSQVDCNASHIEEIFLVGMGQSKRCKSRPNMFFSTTHSIPNCIWQIQSLREIYLSGNGVVGTIDSMNLPHISKLIIDHNCIGGKLPHLLNFSTAFMVDISANKITGQLKVNKVNEDEEEDEEFFSRRLLSSGRHV
jgi:Leucine-rich repeat (LRR) protein